MGTFMNTARLGTGIQGLGACEVAFQNSIEYARERVSLRSLSGTKRPDLKADPLIHHPDIRRMLLTQKAFAEGSRALLYYCAMMGDFWMASTDAKKAKEIDDYLGLFTPIAKGFVTEVGLESASHGMQIWGGHGYIKENGMEQIYRDARIATLYEGTTGIQALDLLGRKVLMKKPPGKLLIKFAKQIAADSVKIVQEAPNKLAVAPLAAKLGWYTAKWLYATTNITVRAARNKDIVNAACVDYLMFSGYVTLAYFHLRMLATAQKKLAKGDVEDPDFLKAKIQTAEFYFSHLLPRANGHMATMLNSPKNMMQTPDELFTKGRA